MYAEPSRLEFSPVGESHVKMRTPSAPPMNPDFPPPPLTPPDSGEYSHLSKGCTPGPLNLMDPPAPSRHPYPRFVKDHFTGSCTCGILAPRSVGGWTRLPPAFPPRHRQGENTMVRTIGLWSVLMLALACPAWAQVQSGSVLVKVVDDQGAVVPGVTVTLTSPVLPRPLVGVTDSAGVQRFT